MTGLSYSPDRADVDESAMVQGVVTVGTTQVEAKVGASALANRQEVRISNKSNATIYVGPTGVTTTTGEKLFKDQAISYPIGNSLQLFMIAATAGNDVVITELA